MPEVEAEEVETIINALKNTSCNVDCPGVRWMENDSETKRDQMGSIPKRTWGLQTITGEILIKGCESGK